MGNGAGAGGCNYRTLDDGFLTGKRSMPIAITSQVFENNAKIPVVMPCDRRDSKRRSRPAGEDITRVRLLRIPTRWSLIPLMLRESDATQNCTTFGVEVIGDLPEMQFGEGLCKKPWPEVH